MISAESLQFKSPLEYGPEGSKVNNDNVALEAGRKKGLIKKIRGVFAALIEEIQTAQDMPSDELGSLKQKYQNLKSELDRYKKFYEDALSREIMLVNKIN